MKIHFKYINLTIIFRIMECNKNVIGQNLSFINIYHLSFSGWWFFIEKNIPQANKTVEVSVTYDENGKPFQALMEEILKTILQSKPNFWIYRKLPANVIIHNGR